MRALSPHCRSDVFSSNLNVNGSAPETILAPQIVRKFFTRNSRRLSSSKSATSWSAYHLSRSIRRVKRRKYSSSTDSCPFSRESGRSPNTSELSLQRSLVQEGQLPQISSLKPSYLGAICPRLRPSAYCMAINLFLASST